MKVIFHSSLMYIGQYWSLKADFIGKLYWPTPLLDAIYRHYHIVHPKNYAHNSRFTVFCFDWVPVGFIDILPSCLIHWHWINHTLQWRHNERDGVSNDRLIDCLFKRLFRRRSKKTSKLRVTVFCEGNPPVTGGFPSQRTINTFDYVTMRLLRMKLGGICIYYRLSIYRGNTMLHTAWQ